MKDIMCIIKHRWALK